MADECGSIRIEKPRPAAHSIASSELAAIHTGGCGDCAGFGNISRSSKRKCWPVKLSRSSVQARNTISTASRNREVLSSGGTPKAVNSTRAKPRPAPQLTRPPEFEGRPCTPFRLEHVDAVPVSGKQLEPSVRQRLGEDFQLLRGDPALVAAHQQHRGFDPRQKRPYIDCFETLVQGGGDIGV